MAVIGQTRAGTGGDLSGWEGGQMRLPEQHELVDSSGYQATEWWTSQAASRAKTFWHIWCWSFRSCNPVQSPYLFGCLYSLLFLRRNWNIFLLNIGSALVLSWCVACSVVVALVSMLMLKLIAKVVYLHYWATPKILVFELSHFTTEASITLSDMSVR